MPYYSECGPGGTNDGKYHECGSAGNEGGYYDADLVDTGTAYEGWGAQSEHTPDPGMYATHTTVRRAPC